MSRVLTPLADHVRPGFIRAMWTCMVACYLVCAGVQIVGAWLNNAPSWLLIAWVVEFCGVTAAFIFTWAWLVYRRKW